MYILQYDGHMTQILSPDWPVVFVYHTQRIYSRPIVDKWLVSGNGVRHLNGHKKKIPGQIVDITANLLLDELLIIVYLYCVRAWINKTTNAMIVFITQI